MSSSTPSEVAEVERITLQEAAARLGVHYMTAYRYVRTGRLAATHDGVRWWVDPADVSGFDRRSRPGRSGVRRRSRPELRRRLESRLLGGDQAGAWTVVEAALGAGAEATEVLLDLLGPAMESIGTRWEAGELSVGDEHRATVVALRLIGRLGPLFTRPGSRRGTVVVGAPPGELHSVPIAMGADVLRAHGFDVVDLGADAPTEAFTEAAQRSPRPFAVAIGATTGDHDRAIRAVVRSLRGVRPELPVLVGGRAIAGPDHAQRLGASFSGGDAGDLARAVEAIRAATPRSSAVNEA